MKEIYKECTLCPRMCRIDRTKNAGFCKTGDKSVVSKAMLHFWEEPCISGKNGSGAVFFSGCNLGCIYCQNEKISRQKIGEKITDEGLSEIFLELCDRGAENINLVTPTHFVPNIINAIILSKKRGISVPFIYNSSGYERVETLKMLDGLIDVYLPDFKYINDETAYEYSYVADYSTAAEKAICEMFRQVGKAKISPDGMIKKGMIVRHLILPGHIIDAKIILKKLYETYKDDIFISIMNQYTPMESVENHPKLRRTITDKEYESVIDYVAGLGTKNAFIQGKGTKSKKYIPDFSKTK